MVTGGSLPNIQGLANNPYPQPSRPIDNYFLKIHSNIFLPSKPRPF